MSTRTDTQSKDNISSEICSIDGTVLNFEFWLDNQELQTMLDVIEENLN